jgi:hypothetical protein
VEWTSFKRQVRLYGEGARIFDPGRIIGEGRELARPGLREAQLADRRQTLAESDMGNRVRH